MIMTVIMITFENLALCEEYLPQICVVVFFIVGETFLLHPFCPSAPTPAKPTFSYPIPISHLPGLVQLSLEN